MAPFPVVARSLAFSTLGICLVAVAGCDSTANNPSLTPEAPAKQQEARQAAYGKAGVPGGKAPKGQAAKPPGK